MLDWDYYGQYGNVIDLGMRSKQVAAPGIESEVQPGRWLVQLRARDGRPRPRGDPGRARHPGARPQREGGPGDRAGQGGDAGAARRPPTPSASPEEGDDDGGGSGFALVIPGVAGLLIGAAGGFARGAQAAVGVRRALLLALAARAGGAGRRDGAGAGRRRWSAAARSPTRRCSSPAATATRSSRASGCSTASGWSRASSCGCARSSTSSPARSTRTRRSASRSGCRRRCAR